MSKKLNIILDLDECLLHSILGNSGEGDYKTFSSYKKQFKKQGFKSYAFKYKFDRAKHDEYSVTFIRPHLQTFITYLFKNYNVSVWSNGYYIYVDKICDIIFTKSQRKKLKIIFGASQSINKNFIVYDIKNKKKVYDFEKHNNWIKDLSHLFKTKPYSTIFNKDNTILVDDQLDHLNYNKHNVLNIKHWLFYEQDDTTLLKLIDFLKSPNIKTNKLPILNKFKSKTKKAKSKTKKAKSKTKKAKSKTKKAKSKTKKIKTKKSIKKGGSLKELEGYNSPIPPIKIAPQEGFAFENLLIESGIGLPPVIQL